MKRLFLGVAALTISATTVMAQQTAEQMTCNQAQNYFAQNGLIYKTVQGSVMPIRKGTPISQPLPGCHGPLGSRFTYHTQTLDNPRCVISHYCIRDDGGFADLHRFGR